ncbi:hypothetical protein [Escherichia phage dw-ec]|nr:hypothetical protein [Escherichia phage BI-EHEC]UJQ43737.1 hypothetical protein [Escherichia phage dw-ec]
MRTPPKPANKKDKFIIASLTTACILFSLVM